ncbi:MAG: serine/threonine protein kinase [Deltaproteobacteria bacterium]|nr:serine/threonine protein kinase [Deltaproteobacteria bacterium]
MVSSTTSSGSSFGSYRLFEQLGVGGMATVHRAEHQDRPGESLALKRLRPELAAIPEFVQAFVDEARLASYLHHPNVAQTYDFGKVDETYFLAMELVRGPTLSQLLRERSRIPLPVSLYLIVQLCDALEYAHNLCDAEGNPLGIIHRDVTPANIIVSTAGIAKLIDFGIAKAASSSVRTKTGFIKGKFAYVAPEYIAGKIDTRVDLFAAGVIAHELLTGRRLFQVENDMETLKRVQRMPIEPPSKWNPKVPPALDEIVMTSLARNPDERWQRASAMRNAFVFIAQRLPTQQQVARWLADVPVPEPSAATSGVSIEIQLIEETMVTNARRPGFAEHLITARTRATQQRLWVIVVVLSLVLLGLLAYLFTH